MSAIRTSLALIGFGFTIFEFFSKLEESRVITRIHSPRHFGAVLVYLGVGMMCVGIVYHLQFMLALRRIRTELIAEGLVRGETPFPVSYTLIIALLLLAVGVAAMVTLELD